MGRDARGIPTDFPRENPGPRRRLRRQEIRRDVPLGGILPDQGSCPLRGLRGLGFPPEIRRDPLGPSRRDPRRSRRIPREGNLRSRSPSGCLVSRRDTPSGTDERWISSGNPKGPFGPQPSVATPDGFPLEILTSLPEGIPLRGLGFPEENPTPTFGAKKS